MRLSIQILLAFTVILVFSVIDSYTNYMLTRRVERNTEFLSRSETIIRNSAKLHKGVIEMQSAFRGFLLTDDQGFINIYNKGIIELPVLFLEQEDLVRADSRQFQMLDSIQLLHRQWVNYADSLISTRQLIASSDAARMNYQRLFETKLKKQVGKKLNDQITQKFGEFDRSEYQQRQEKGRLLIESINHTRTYSIIFLSLTILIGIVGTIYIVRLISKRIATMVQLAQNISHGQFSTIRDTKNDELTALSSSLNIMSEKLSKNIHELERQNDELNRFAYVVSHDLKAPVRGIHNVIQWIEEDLGHELSPEMKRYLAIIPQRTRRMEDLINGLLDYARVRKKTTVELIDSHALVNEIVSSIVPRTTKVEIHNMPVLRSERLKLEQVFGNLISNAVKYTHRDDARIIISCTELPVQYEFSVSDNGMGIEEEYHEKIFEIFQTLREKDEQESTGIGLAIVKKIIDDLHCTIRLRSSPGTGTDFIFTWPKSQTEQI